MSSYYYTWTGIGSPINKNPPPPITSKTQDTNTLINGLDISNIFVPYNTSGTSQASATGYNVNNTDLNLILGGLSSTILTKSNYSVNNNTDLYKIFQTLPPAFLSYNITPYYYKTATYGYNIYYWVNSTYNTSLNLNITNLGYTGQIYFILVGGGGGGGGVTLKGGSSGTAPAQGASGGGGGGVTIGSFSGSSVSSISVTIGAGGIPGNNNLVINSTVVATNGGNSYIYLNGSTTASYSALGGGAAGNDNGSFGTGQGFNGSIVSSGVTFTQNIASNGTFGANLNGGPLKTPTDGNTINIDGTIFQAGGGGEGGCYYDSTNPRGYTQPSTNIITPGTNPPYTNVTSFGGGAGGIVNLYGTGYGLNGQGGGGGGSRGGGISTNGDAGARGGYGGNGSFVLFF